MESTVIDRFDRRQLIWYGHVVRMNEERWPRKVLDYTPPNRRKKGRPRKTWKDGITNAMNNNNISPDDI